MAWITTKDGRRVNTDWFDEEEKKKYAQIEANAEQAFLLNKRMNIPFDEWKHQEEVTDSHWDASNPYSTTTSDETRYVNEKDIRKMTKKKALDDIESWKMDDGTYGAGEGDESIHVIYDDGSVVELTDGEKHRGWKTKAPIRGISISTADYSIAWGEEYYPREHEWRPVRTLEFDDNANPIEGYSNSYSGYKATGKYKVRREETTFKNSRDRWEKKYKTLAMSTVKKL